MFFDFKINNILIVLCVAGKNQIDYPFPQLDFGSIFFELFNFWRCNEISFIKNPIFH